MSDSVVNFRVDSDLKKAFELVAENRDLTSSQLLRAFMRESVDEYMKKNAQKSLLKPSNNKPIPKAKKQKSIIPNAWRLSDGRKN